MSYTGWASTETQCHLVLVHTGVNYHVTVRNVPFTVHSASFSTESTVDHNQYLAVIQAYAGQGWELAGLIDLPDVGRPGGHSITSTIKLIFQAPARGEGAASQQGGYLSPYFLDLTVPEGASPGSSMEVKNPKTGDTVSVTVPQGVGPGDKFRALF